MNGCSLQSHCMLAIISNVSSYTADVLALLPPRLRTRILINVPAIDLYRLSKCSDFLTGLIIDIEEVWKHRFNTSLLKYSNISPFDEIPSRQISWKDRYLLSCLQNIPHQYRTTAICPPLSGAMFIISNITFSDTGMIKMKVGSTLHGLHCVKGRLTPDTDISCHFISLEYMKLLDSYPYNLTVGCDIPVIMRIKLITKHFPNWCPSVFPLEYDDDSTEWSEMLVKEVTNKLETIFIYTKYLRMFRNSECTEYSNKVNSPVFSETTAKIIAVVRNNTKCDDIVISQPAMLKSDDSNLIPVTFSSAQLLEEMLSQFPNVKHLSITMHYSDQDCINNPLFLKEQLTSLHLRVARPNFEDIISPSIAITTIRDLRLHGIHIAGRNFIDILLAYLNTPTAHEQSLSLGSLKIDTTNVPAIAPQMMAKNCCYKKSLYLHRVYDNNLLKVIFAAYPKISFNTLLLSLGDRLPPFPEKTLIHAKTFILKQTRINASSISIYKPVLELADKVELSVSIESSNANEVITLLCKCISTCSYSLQYLDFHHFLPLADLSQLLVNQLYVCIFNLPTSTIADLVIDPGHIIAAVSNVLMQKQGIRLANIVQLREQEMRQTVENWKSFYDVWKNEGKKVLKSVSGVPNYVSAEIEDLLKEMTSNINIVI